MDKLLFDRPASKWEEAIPLGNGFLGAMVHGKTDKELIEMNEDSLWSGPKMERRSPIADSYIQDIRALLEEGKVEEAQKLSVRSMFSTTPHSRHYQPLGQVWIEFHNQNQVLEHYERTLDLTTAICHINYNDTNGSCMEREAFLSYPENVMVYRLSAGTQGALNFDLYLQRRDTRSGKTVSYLESITCKDEILSLSGYQGNRMDGIDYTMACSIQLTGGTLTSYGTRLVVEGASEAIIYVTGRTSYRDLDPSRWCTQKLNSAMKKPYDELKAVHQKDYQSYYDAMSLHLPDEAGASMLPTPERLKRLKEGKHDPNLISLYFNFARYLMIASSREGSLPANLQGIWANEFEPSWGSKYTININLQMNYWMAEKAGLSNLHMPLMEFLQKMLPRAKETASAIYHTRGACAHHNTDIWCDCDPMDFNPASTIWPMGYVWLSLHIMEHFRYTRDKAFIEQYFTILEENALFLIDYVYLDQVGYAATGPSVSPENTYRRTDGKTATICKSPTMDIQIIREFLTRYLELCQTIEKTNYCKEAEAILQKLPPIQIGKHGQIMEWQEDYDEIEPGHRHISQLFGLYPGTQIRYDKTPELIQAVHATLSRRLNHGGGHTGWSCAWIIHFYARLREGKLAYDMLEKLLCESTLDNLFDNCPPFQIDGNFGGANGILEMLVQDDDKHVYLLPAAVKQLEKGSIKKLVLACGATLSFEWESCEVKQLTLHAHRNLGVCLHIGNSEYKVVLLEGEDYFMQDLCSPERKRGVDVER